MASILFVEDEALLKELMTHELLKAGFRVDTAEDGAEALEKLTWRKDKPDLVLLDLVIPKVSGMDVLKKIKSTPALAHIPVLILSNLSERREIDACKKLGAADYMVKAKFLPSQVIAKCKTVLKSRKG